MSFDHVELEETARDRDSAHAQLETESEPDLSVLFRPGSATRSPAPEQDNGSNSAALQEAHYPLNSRRLTAAHMRAIAGVLGLPTAGSPDQLRQCIEGKIQTEREDPNVVVVVRTVQVTGQELALADSEGEFVSTPPSYLHGVRNGHQNDNSRELQEVRAQLQEAEQIIDSAREKDRDQAQQIGELQETLRGQEERIIRRFEDEIAELKQKVLEGKTKLRQSWKSNCEHLAEQDAIITGKEEEIEELKRKLARLTGEERDTRDEALHRHREDDAETEQPDRPMSRDGGGVSVATGTLPPVGAGRPVTPIVLSRPKPVTGTSYAVARPTHRDLPRGSTSTPTDRQLSAALAATVMGTPATATAATGIATTAGDPLATSHDLPRSEPSRDTLSREPASSNQSRRGKAPPIVFFSGEDPSFLLEDWLPSLERAAQWNGWSEQDQLMQLPGYLKGRALQEWNLLNSTDQRSYRTAVDALQARLDPRNRTMAAQAFRHSMQRQGESVIEFIQRIEKAYRVAYGKDSLSLEVRDALLYSQLYDGLQQEIMRGPAVSGSQSYKELCVAAKGEEHRLAALRQRQQLKTPAETQGRSRKSEGGQTHSHPTSQDQTPSKNQKAPSPKVDTQSVCYHCGKPGHIARNCRQRKQESKGRHPSQTGTSQTRQVSSYRQSSQPYTTEEDVLTPESCLFSDSDDDSARAYTVSMADGGSISPCVKVQVHGVPAYGLIDTGADITIIGGKLFKRVATIARLKKRDFKKADKTPRTYDQQTFKLDGQMDLDISFDGKTLRTPVYIKMDTADQLLLSEGVCRQLGVVTFHSKVEPWRGGHKKNPTPSRRELQQSEAGGDRPTSDAKVPLVRVNLIQSVHLLPHQSRVVEASINYPGDVKSSLFLEGTQLSCGAGVDDSLLDVTEEGTVLTTLSNPTGSSITIDQGSTLGTVEPVDVVEPLLKDSASTSDPVTATLVVEPDAKLTTVARVCTKAWRKEELAKLIGPTDTLSPTQREELIQFLCEHHSAFVLEENERGETDLVELTIETGETRPLRCAPRRMPFTVREEVARQLKAMQESHVIRPSTSPWASPVVMVRKKDGSHRFCVDYRRLNSVTKLDTYPLPRIDDLLDQLGQCRYFTTLDLASGYWQIRVAPDSQEKTAFVTPQGLYEFLVMPFGLTNAPAVFQRLMQRVLAGLNPEAGPDFVAVYIDDVLVFSRTIEEHLTHLQQVIQRIQEAGLKLKPTKCHFALREVEYLGHVVTPEGLKTNKKLVDAVAMFPKPTDANGVRRFLGLASYYRRFIERFAKIAAPLRELTRKNVTFHWTRACDEAMKVLQEKLTAAPVLAYPSFDKPFTVETDACIDGLGAVLQQMQDDSKLHPVAYASRSLTPAERNYGITELEALAVVWALTRFHSYLYGQSVTVVTDHAAVRAVLETPSPSAKHARWWTRVYGTGLKDVHIVYRPGRLNAAADALSRNPQSGPPVAGEGEQETQVFAMQSSPVADSPRDENDSISDLLVQPPQMLTETSFAHEQRKDNEVAEIITFLETGELPQEEKRARQVALQKSLFVLEEGILYYADPKQEHRLRVVVPTHLKEQVLSEHHSGPTGGHFAAKKMYGALTRHWWWDGMHRDTVRFATSCPQCAIVTAGSRPHRPELHPIPVKRPFQIVGVDIMELPTTERGNRYVLVFHDFLTKWPMVYPMPNQKSIRIVELLVNEVIPQFGVPESLLSDRGTNLLSHLMQDVCKLLGLKKLNTTAHHPQCDGMVERFNRTLKTMLRKYAAEFSTQWDKYLPGALWAYRNVPHDSTGEKPSFLLYGIDCRTPTEAALLPTHTIEPTEVSDYREQLVLSLSSARRLAAEAIQTAQAKYKKSYDRHSHNVHYQIGDWVLVHFPQDEAGKMRKLCRPWHGPYRVIDVHNPDVTVVKVYVPQDGQIQVHQSRVVHCPTQLPAGFYWYGNRRSGPGRPSKWVEKLLQGRVVPLDAERECGLSTQNDTRSDDGDAGSNVAAQTPEPRLSVEGTDPDHRTECDRSVDDSVHDLNPLPYRDVDGTRTMDAEEEDKDTPQECVELLPTTKDKEGENALSTYPRSTAREPTRRSGLRKKTKPPTRLMLTQLEDESF